MYSCRVFYKNLQNLNARGIKFSGNGNTSPFKLQLKISDAVESYLIFRYIKNIRSICNDFDIKKTVLLWIY